MLGYNQNPKLNNVYFKTWDGNGFGDDDEFNDLDTDVNGNAIQNKTLSVKLPFMLGDN